MAIVDVEEAGFRVEWQQKWPEARPRWGTFSVRAHTDLRQLITDVLMYDVVVFPCPEDEEDFARWEHNQWDPKLLATRATQLGDHVATVPWDRTLREVWKYRYDQLSDEQREDPSIGYDLTASQLAGRSFLTLIGPEDDRVNETALNPPEIHPAFARWDARNRAGHEELEIVAAFQHPWESVWLTGTSASADLSKPGPFSADPGVRVRMGLAVPEDADETMFHRVLDLIENDDFQHARRRLWSWERELPNDPDPPELQLLLEALVADHNNAVKRHLQRTRLQTVFLLVPAAVGVALDMVSGGWVGAALGAGASVAIDSMKGRFPVLSGEAARASHHPGSAVAGMLSVVSQT